MKETIDRSPGVLDLLEEAVHVLRTAGAVPLACYCVGVLPMLLAALYFWADMASSPFAHLHVVEASAGLLAAFVWMRCWQTVFMRLLLSQLCCEPPEPWTPRRVVRMAIFQAAVQPWGLLLTPASALLTFPLPWVYGFFQGAALWGDGRSPHAESCGEAWRSCRLWPWQATWGLSLLLLMAIIAWLNALTAVGVVPLLLKTLFGVETVFTQGGFSGFSSVFMAITLALAYLAVNPVAKAFYVVRMFHGRSRQTGQDLLADLHALARPAATVAAAVLAAAVLAWPAEHAAAATPQQPETAVEAQGPGPDPAELDRSIQQVIERREFTWRMPRPQEQEQQGGFWNSIRTWWRNLTREREHKDEPPPRQQRHDDGNLDGGRGGGSGLPGVVNALMYILIVAAIAGIGVLLYRVLRSRQPKDADADAAEASAAPDLAADDLSPEQLPPDGWLDLARKMMAQGDRRLALRAMYLASLSLLAQHGLVTAAKYKSNRQYLGELQRRGHALPQVVGAFGRNVTHFEDSWYGMHDVTDEIVEDFLTNQQRIRSLGTT